MLCVSAESTSCVFDVGFFLSNPDCRKAWWNATEPGMNTHTVVLQPLFNLSCASHVISL